MGWTRAVRALGTIAVAGTAAGLVACASEPTPGADQPQQQPAAPNVILASAMVNLPTAVPAGELPDSASQGARLVTQFCGQACHGLPAPTSHSATDWPVVLRRMWLRMSRIDSTYQIQVPSTAERAVMMDYMLAHALTVSAGTLPDAPGRELYAEKCSACHGLPDIRQHAPDDWVAVVRRMNGRMQNLIGVALSQDEMQRIVLYLEAASRS